MMEHTEGDPALQVTLVPNMKQNTKTKMTRFLVCPDCPVLFPRRQSLLRHRIQSHAFVPPFNCDKCTTILITQEDYNKHMAAHSEAKKHKCKICGKLFAQATSLTRHMRYSHTMERPYKCNICPFSAVEPHKLTIHLRIHTGEAPYICKECGSCFKSNISLKRHLATHSDKKEYICVLCFKQFSIVNTLRIHMQKMHAVENNHIEGVRVGSTHGIDPILQSYFDSLGESDDSVKNIDRSSLRYYHIRDEFANTPAKHFKNISDYIIAWKGGETRHYDNEDIAPITVKGVRKDKVSKDDKVTGIAQGRNKKRKSNEPILNSDEELVKRGKRTKLQNAMESALKDGFNISTDDLIAPLNPNQISSCDVDDDDVGYTVLNEKYEVVNNLVETLPADKPIAASAAPAVKLEYVGDDKPTSADAVYSNNIEEDPDNTDCIPSSIRYEADSATCKIEDSGDMDAEAGNIEETFVNKSDCVKLSEDPDKRRAMLSRMKVGEFGYRPRVIRVLDDGTIVNITDKYVNSLPND